MKSIFNICLALAFSSVLIHGCSKQDNSANSIETYDVTPVSSSMSSNGEKKWHIFHASWDEWGRAKKNCDGWGLCNVQSCWFCCTDDKGNIIDCKTNQIIPKSASVEIDPETLIGSMYIKLDPGFMDQKNAIDSLLDLYIDEDILNENFTIHTGIYKFDPTVGTKGGYILHVTGK